MKLGIKYVQTASGGCCPVIFNTKTGEELEQVIEVQTICSAGMAPEMIIKILPDLLATYPLSLDVAVTATRTRVVDLNNEQ